eukprot:4856004-Pleurochrysis_carterae.AAC.1
MLINICNCTLVQKSKKCPAGAESYRRAWSQCFFAVTNDLAWSNFEVNADGGLPKSQRRVPLFPWRVYCCAGGAVVAALLGAEREAAAAAAPAARRVSDRRIRPHARLLHARLPY